MGIQYPAPTRCVAFDRLMRCQHATCIEYRVEYRISGSLKFQNVHRNSIRITRIQFKFVIYCDASLYERLFFVARGY